MTMSLTLVNTSNWDNEIYVVEQPKYAFGSDEVEEVRLRPGESTRVFPKEGGSAIKVTPLHEDERPFKLPNVVANGYGGGERSDIQVEPKVTVTFE